MIAVIALILALLFNTWLSYFVSNKVYQNLKRNNVKYAVLLEVLIFLSCFIVVALLAVILIVKDIQFGR